MEVDIKVFKYIQHSYNRILNKTLDTVGQLIIDEAKRAFRERKFNNQNWKQTTLPSKSTGKLANSLQKYLSNDTVEVLSNLIYSGIQNNGGRIKVTEKMRRFFWSQYYKTKNQFWKNAALTKKTEIIIPERKYLDITNSVILFAKQELSNNFKTIVNGGTI